MKNSLKIITLVFSLTFSLLINAQTPTIEWQYSYGGSATDEIESIIQTTDGGYISVGHSNSSDGDIAANNGDLDFWIIKTNSVGVLEWEKSLGGSANDIGYDIIQTNDGGYILCGSATSSNGDVASNYGSHDVWVVKLSNLGAITWEKNYGGTGIESANSIKQTTDGGYVIAGRNNINNGDVTGNHGDYDYWLLKINSTGVLQWQQSYGGTGYDVAHGVEQTTDGGYVITGHSNSNDGDVTGNNGNYDAWVVKINPAGVIQWQNSLGGTNSDALYTVKQTSDGGYILAGQNSSIDGDVIGNQGSVDYWVVKLNSVGGLVWQNSLGGSANDIAYAVDLTNDGGYVVAGRSISSDGDITMSNGNWDIWINKLNSSGTLIWEKSIGGTGFDEGEAILQNSDGDYIVAGHNKSNDGDATSNHGSSDFWIVKLKNCTDNEIVTHAICNNENYIFGTQTLTMAGTYSETFTNSVGCDSIVNLTLSILQSNSLTFNDTICDNDTYQFGTQTLNFAGQFVEVFQNQVGCDSVVTLNLAVELLPLASVTMVGNDLQANLGGDSYQWYFNGIAISGAIYQIYTPNQNGNYTVDVISQRGCIKTSVPFEVISLGIKDYSFNFSVVPNPGTGVFTISSNDDFTYKVYHSTGELIFESLLKNSESKFSITSYKNGIYIVIISTKRDVKVVKLIKH